jgi:hypothetical protein
VEFIFEWRRKGGNHCFYCGSEFGKEGTLMAVSEEHVYPKFRFSLHHNTVKACRGCNFAKNGFMPEEFREWMGEEFYAEWLLGEPLPPVRDRLLHELYKMVDKHFNAEMARIKAEQPFGGQRLTLKLRQIMRDARGYPVRRNCTSQTDPKNKS